MSDWTCHVTLTYAPRDDLADKVICIKHFQNFMKSLRFHGTRVRYLVAGEYGERKGRAHFHVILFGKGPKPDWPHEKRCWPTVGKRGRLWPHGHMFCQWQPDERGIRYVCKYVLKADNTEQYGEGGHSQSWLSLSKKPALGHEWFMQKAERDAALGVYPSTFHYMPPGGVENKQYLMTGATKRDYLNRVRALQGRKPDHQINPYVREAFEKQDLAAWKKELEAQTPEALFQMMVDEIHRKTAENRREEISFWNFCETRYSGIDKVDNYRKAFEQWQTSVKGIGARKERPNERPPPRPLQALCHQTQDAGVYAEV